jgi:hypothetical protein
MTEPNDARAHLEARLLDCLARAPRTGLVAGELAILVGEPGVVLDEALAELVAKGDAFSLRRAGLTYFHPRGAKPLAAHDAFDDVMGYRRGSGRGDPEPQACPVRWWAFEEEEGTHMDLRRWFDARYAEGWRVMRIEAAPDTFGLGAGPLYQVVLLGGRDRHRKRRLWPSEHEWLLRAWPVQLRTRGVYDGLLA